MNFGTLKYFQIFGNGENLTISLLKNLWRKVCVKVHPDKGGTHEKYIEAQTEYEILLKYAKADFTAKADSPEAYNSFIDFLAHISPVVHECLKAVVKISGIKVIEITGYWVWLSLDFCQKTERELVKQISIDGKRFQWHSLEKKWVWKGVPASGYRVMDWEEKKAHWGYDRYEKPDEKKEVYTQIA